MPPSTSAGASSRWRWCCCPPWRSPASCSRRRSCASTSSASDAADREAQIELGVFLLRWFMPQMIFYGIGAIACGLLNTERRFAAPMFAPDPEQPRRDRHVRGLRDAPRRRQPSVGDITWLEKTVLGAGTTLGVVAMTVALWPSLRATGFRWRLAGGWGHPGIRRIVAALRVGRRLRRRQPTRLRRDQHARRRHLRRLVPDVRTAFIIFLLPHSIFAVSIFTALLPRWPSGGGTRRRRGARSFLARTARHDRHDRAGGSFAFIALAEPIVTLLLEYGGCGKRTTRSDRTHAAGFRAGAAVLLGVPADHPHVLRDAGQPDPRTRQHRRGGRHGRRRRTARAHGRMGHPGLALGHAVSYASRPPWGCAVAPPARLPRRAARVRHDRAGRSCGRRHGRHRVRVAEASPRRGHADRRRPPHPGARCGRHGPPDLSRRSLMLGSKRSMTWSVRCAGGSADETVRDGATSRGLVARQRCSGCCSSPCSAWRPSTRCRSRLTTFKLSDVATEAASDGAAAFRSQHERGQACDVASDQRRGSGSRLKIGRTVARSTTHGPRDHHPEAIADTVAAAVRPNRGVREVLVTEANGPSNV